MKKTLSIPLSLFYSLNLFARCLLLSICLHCALYCTYYITTGGLLTYDSESIMMQPVDVDFHESMFENQGKASARAKKNEWIEGKGKNIAQDKQDDRPSGTDDTDQEGYLYSFRGDSPPKAVINFDLRQYFPREARRANIQSRTVVLKIQVDEDGALKNATVISTRAGYGFDEAALAIVKRARFKPGYIKGKPVRMVHRLPIQFVLE